MGQWIRRCNRFCHPLPRRSIEKGGASMVHQTNEETKRKEYSVPKLITYGDIVEITRDTGAIGMTDHGTAVGKTQSA
jgi:hypothetical protein